MFTIVALFVLLILANIFFTQSRRTGHDSQTAVFDRISADDDFLRNLETDSKRGAYIAGFRTFVALEQYTTTTGTFIPDVDTAFKQVFMNGSYGNVTFAIMENSTFTAYLARVQQVAASQGILFNATVTNLTVRQSDSWTVLVEYALEANVTDTRGIAGWHYHNTFIGVIPIDGINDPVYTVRTYGRTQVPVQQSPYSSFVTNNSGTINASPLMTHFQSGQYYDAKMGPSILMRFEGNLTDDPQGNGIESLIDIDKLPNEPGLPPVNTTLSIVDYEYFSGVKATVCDIKINSTTPLDAKMKFDNAHIVVYNLSLLQYGACP